MNDNLPDIQETKPDLNIALKQVGVQNIELPFILKSKYGGFYNLNADVSIRTNLDSETKGISMSRLILTLKPYLNLPLSSQMIKQILLDVMKNIGSTTSFIKFCFRMPLNKKSIKSNNEFPIYYKCKFEGQYFENDSNFRFYQGVIIQYASYCPCSAELCNHLTTQEKQGYPHNQRSFADILVECAPNEHFIWLEDIIENVENALITLPYPIIKRVDEQEIARVAAENPLFVED
jgi:GTP cyclohydrolase I